MNDSYNSVREIHGNMSRNFKLKGLYEEKRQELLTQITDMNLVSDIKQEDVLEIVYNCLQSNDIEIVNINFSEVEPVEINTSVNEMMAEYDDDHSLLENEQDELSVTRMIVNIEFKSSYDNLLNFIDDLQSNSTNMVITNIHTIKDESNLVYVVMDISFHAISMGNEGSGSKIEKYNE